MIGIPVPGDAFTKQPADGEPAQVQVDSDHAVRRRWRLSGQVQGVGFRPAVYRAAQRHGLVGFVRNEASDVVLEVQGIPARLEAFITDLLGHLPPLAHVEQHSDAALPVVPDAEDFRIDGSQSHELSEAIHLTVDTSVCDDCLAELFSATDRRQGYPLINCTNCGPRYSITKRVPYDRPNTTMGLFTLCPACAAEYSDPINRRFHAQPTACSGCGPRLHITTSGGDESRPIESQTYEIAARLFAGEVVAIQGIGGFHLAARAANGEAVARLRRVKHRDAKPFALMCRSAEDAQRLVLLSAAGLRLLASAARPIVLAPRRTDAPVAPLVAPSSHRLGVMLPYTPMQHLLFRAAPDLGPLVMTSCNESDEPLAIAPEQVTPLLGPERVSAIWRHERTIYRSVDDSVVLDSRCQEPQMIRRSRGYVPQPWLLPQGGSQGLCLGGELKGVVGIVRNGELVLSQHLGDLTHPASVAALRRTVDDLCNLYQAQLDWVAVDMHPGYASSRYGAELADRFDLPLLRIQHHHAHAAATMAEWRLAGPALAVVCDGVGYGDDGGVWGGELLLADYGSFTRLARLRPLQLVGGDAAARDARRCGLAMLQQLDSDPTVLENHPLARRWFPNADDRRLLVGLLASGVQCVASSSVGRLFDGIAALLGLNFVNRYEGESAQRVEAAAHERFVHSLDRRASGGESDAVEQADRAAHWFSLVDGPVPSSLFELDCSPLVREMVAAVGALPVHQVSQDAIDLSPKALACAPDEADAWADAFHEALAAGWEAAVLRAAREHDMSTVVLGGGVFCNEILTHRLRVRLERHGLAVFRPTQFPPNDGGLALGQAAIASARVASGALCDATRGGDRAENTPCA